MQVQSPVPVVSLRSICAPRKPRRAFALSLQRAFPLSTAALQPRTPLGPWRRERASVCASVCASAARA
eukprot:6175420-Pleurochrysis_carterae.AAC.2